MIIIELITIFVGSGFIGYGMHSFDVGLGAALLTLALWRPPFQRRD